MASLSTYIRRSVLRPGRLGGGAGKHGTLLTEGGYHNLDEGGEVTVALEEKGERREGAKHECVPPQHHTAEAPQSAPLSNVELLRMDEMAATELCASWILHKSM